ncbi:S-antigen family protein, partial [Pseudomonas aeruginosa PA21_ST175]
YKGTATAGEKGEIRIRYWDEKTERYRTVIGYIGEDGLEPNVPYKLSAGRKLVRA